MGEQDRDVMNEAEETAYTQGKRAAWTSMLATCLRNLGYDAPDVAQMVLQREQTLAALRSVCADHGDNDWSDDLSLADVIEKHLHHHLEQRR
jgi:hypothetical protein